MQLFKLFLLFKLLSMSLNHCSYYTLLFISYNIRSTISLKTILALYILEDNPIFVRSEE